MYISKYLIISLFSFISLTASEYIANIQDAKVGECYKKVYLPAKFVEKEELIEVEKASKNIKITDPKFKEETKCIVVAPAYTDIKDTMALFKKQSIKLPTNKKEIYYTIGKKKEIPLSDDFVKYVQKKGVDLKKLKVGECYAEYVKLAPLKSVKKEFVKKQAYEIIDVEPPKFKTVKKKIEVRPAYTKIVKTPAVYETKTVKILLKPAKKEFITKKDGTVCVVRTPPKYKEVVKKIMKTPPMTKVIKFPPTYKIVEVKVLQKPPVVKRRVVPQVKGSYDFYVRSGKNIYFWTKDKVSSDAKPTGLKICKREKDVKFIEKEVEVVEVPATTNKVKVPAKSINIKIKKLIKDANSTVVELPPQYEKIKSQVLVTPAKVVWKRVECKVDDKLDSKQKVLK